MGKDSGPTQQRSEWREDVLDIVKRSDSQDLFTDLCEGEKKKESSMTPRFQAWMNNRINEE